MAVRCVFSPARRACALVLLAMALASAAATATGSKALPTQDWESIRAYLKASNTGAGDRFGVSVAVSADTLVVGAGVEDGPGDTSEDAGAVYVFVRTAGGWSQQAYLQASNMEAADFFGQSVAISGDTLVVGAYGEDSAAGGVDGDQANNGANGSGAAYVFVRDGSGGWSQQAYLKASNARPGHQFGVSVAISGDTVVVGAPLENSAGTGVDGDQGDASASNAGAAYVFVRSGTTWSQQAYLKASNTDTFDDFGRVVAVSGDTIVVGATGEDSAARNVNGSESDDTAPFAGAAYAFVRTGSTWSQQAYLKAFNTDEGDSFGTSLGVSGDTIVVGAGREDSSQVGDPLDNGATNSGAAYVFARSAEGFWSQQAYLKSSPVVGSGQFGRGVAISGNRLVAGTPFSASANAYVFARDEAGSWTQEATLPRDAVGGDRFGEAVAISGDTAVVGAMVEDSAATGVDGDQSNNDATDAGAAYVFQAAYPVGGVVQGLAGTGLVLQNNATDDLPISADGAFVFDTGLADGSAYAVSVAAQPDSPLQECSVSAASGVVAGAGVTGVEVDCVNLHTVTPSAGSGGGIAPSTPQTVRHGETASFSISSDPGQLAAVSGTCGGTLVGSDYTTAPVVADCTILATFLVGTASTLDADAGPVRIGTPVEMTVQVTGTTSVPAGGLVVVNASSGESCADAGAPQIDGLTATFQCPITFATVGTRTLDASYTGSASHAASAATGQMLSVQRFADIAVSVDDGAGTSTAGSEASYLVELRSTGPDAAPGTRAWVVATPGLLDPSWVCAPVGGATCPQMAGDGMIDQLVDLPADSGLDYLQQGTWPSSLPAVVQLEAQASASADASVFDPHTADNLAADSNAVLAVFASGFE